MELDTYTFFLIILEGFGLVWSFRRASGRHKTITDFEYLGFSAFWGVLLLGFWQTTSTDIEKFNELLKNPYATGAFLFGVAVILGLFAGKGLSLGKDLIILLKITGQNIRTYFKN